MNFRPALLHMEVKPILGYVERPCLKNFSLNQPDNEILCSIIFVFMNNANMYQELIKFVGIFTNYGYIRRKIFA